VRRVVLIAATLLAIAGFAQSAQAAGWGPEFGVSNPATGGSQFRGASVVPRQGGGFIYVWADSTPATAGVKTRVAYPDGSLGPVRTIAPGYIFAIPIFAAAGGSESDNRVAFAFQRKDCSACYYSYALYSGTLNPDGQLTGDPQVLQQVGPSAWDEIRNPSLSVAPDGNALIAWQSLNSSGDSLGLGMAEPGEEFVVDAYNPDETSFSRPSVAARNGGGGFVAYGSDTGGPSVSGFMITADGDMTDPEPMAGGTNGNDLRTVIDSTGKATVAFGQTVGPDFRLYERQMGADGEPLGTDAMRIAEADAALYDGSIAIGPDDSVAIGMTQYDSFNSNYVSIAVKISPDGTLGTTQTISDPLFESSGTQVAYDGSGPVAFVTEEDDAGDEDLLLFQRLDENFEPSGTPSVVGAYKSQDSFDFHSPPVFTESGDGSFVWSSSIAAAGFGSQLDASIYDAGGPELDLWIPPAATRDLEVVMGADASDPNGPATLAWDFGDGGTATGAYVKHTFSATGDFNVKVTATDAVGNETSRTVPVRVVAAPDPDPGPPEPVIPPDTRITGKPAKKVKAKTATFKFTSSLTGSKFECRLDKAGWTDCRSPKRLKKLKPGKHTFKVRAIMGDLIDPTPAGYDWTVKKGKKPRP